MPDLALAAEERPAFDTGTATINDAPQQQAPPPNLDDLAEQVYTRIRRRIQIERERNWT
jgi:hypothetical protein